MQKTATRDVRLNRTEPLITPAELIEQLQITPEIEAMAEAIARLICTGFPVDRRSR